MTEKPYPGENFSDLVIGLAINLALNILSTDKGMILFEKTIKKINVLYFNIESLKIKYNCIDITNAKRDFLKYYINEKNLKIENYVIHVLNFDNKFKLYDIIIYQVDKNISIIDIVDPLFDPRFRELNGLLKYFKVFREGYVIPEYDLIEIIKYLQKVTRLKLFL